MTYSIFFFTKVCYYEWTNLEKYEKIRIFQVHLVKSLSMLSRIIDICFRGPSLPFPTRFKFLKFLKSGQMCLNVSEISVLIKEKTFLSNETSSRNKKILFLSST